MSRKPAAENRIDSTTAGTVWTREDIVTGERLQALADVTIITESIKRFHKSLPANAPLALLPGTMDTITLDRIGFAGPFRVRTRAAAARLVVQALAPAKRARSIFVYTHLLPAFIEVVLPKLEHRFVLITHNSDGLVTDRFRALLDDSRVARWFAQSALIDHPKLECLPIGIANAQWEHGNLDALMAKIVSPPKRTGLVYANFKASTHPDRLPLLDLIKRQPFMTLESSVAFETYLRGLAEHRFCLSPPGNGIDTHRTWEALYLGAIPIVTADFAAIFPSLPMLGVKHWSDIERRMLDEAWARLAPLRRPAQRLRMSWWADQIDRAVAQLGVP